MGRGLAARPRSCVEHPHRPALDVCDECLRPFCGECFVRATERLLCRPCSDAAPARALAAARSQRLTSRLREGIRRRVGGLAVGTVILVVLGGAVALASAGKSVGGTAVSRAFADEPALRQRLVAGRFCAGGDGVSGDVPVPRPGGPSRPGPTQRVPVTGAAAAAFFAVLPDTLLKDDRLASTPLSTDPFDPMNAVRLGPGTPVGWRSRTTVFPQQLGYELRGQVEVDRVGFRHAPTSAPASRAREVSLLLSTEGSDRGFYQVGRWTLSQDTAPQEFLFFETPASYVRVCLYGNYGDSESVSLGVLALGIKGGIGPLLPR